MKNKKNFKNILAIILMLLMASAIILTSCSGNTSKESGNGDSFVLKIGYGGSLCEAPLHIAYEKGFFADEGLTVELTKLAAGTAFDNLTAGNIDASFALLASIIQPLSNGLPAKITTGLHTGCDIVLVKPDSGITKATDLKGKKIGVGSFTASPYIYAKRVLGDSGVDVRPESSEVEFIVYSVSDLPMILSNGEVDAIAMNEPTATIAAKEYGYINLMDSAMDEPYCNQYCCVAYVSDRLIEKNYDAAVKFTRAMQKASSYIQGHQDEIAQIQIEKEYIAVGAGVDASVYAGVLKKLNYIPSVSGAYEAFGTTAPQLQAIGMLSDDIDVKAMQENSFIFLEGLDNEYR